ncbi:MAG: hypothetical protein HYY61_07110 [Deltaproteobacteria bacterium]|nr:hypothetical protein [Deltaproteobacteria bacterium]
MKLNKVVYLLLVAVVVAGCGTDTLTKKNDTVIAPAPVPGQVQTGNILPNMVTSPIQSVFGPRQNGMYDGIGREDLSNQQLQFNAQQPFPPSRNWITRVEILTEDGRNSDPTSFNTPRGLKYIRITLVNDANMALRYTAEGYVWIRPGSFALVGSLRGYVNSVAQFDVNFGYSNFTGPMLGILGLEGRLTGTGMIELVENANGQAVKHIIQY